MPANLTPILQVLQIVSIVVALAGGLGGGSAAFLLWRSQRKLNLANAKNAEASARKSEADYAAQISLAAANAVDRLLTPLQDRVQCLEDEKKINKEQIDMLQKAIDEANGKLTKVTAENIELHQKIAVLLRSEKRLRRLNQKLIQAISDNIKARAEVAQVNSLPCTVWCAPADQILNIALQEILDDQGDDNAPSQ